LNGERSFFARHLFLSESLFSSLSVGFGSFPLRSFVAACAPVDTASDKFYDADHDQNERPDDCQGYEANIEEQTHDEANEKANHRTWTPALSRTDHCSLDTQADGNVEDQD